MPPAFFFKRRFASLNLLTIISGIEVFVFDVHVSWKAGLVKNWELIHFVFFLSDWNPIYFKWFPNYTNFFRYSWRNWSNDLAVFKEWRKLLRGSIPIEKYKKIFSKQFWSFLVNFGTLCPFVGQKKAPNPYSLEKYPFFVFRFCLRSS